MKTPNNMPDMLPVNQPNTDNEMTVFERAKAGMQSGGNDTIPFLNHWQNLLGNLVTTTNTPTRAPRKISEGVKIYVNSISSPTVKRLYVYSRECDAWFYVNLT